MEKWKPVKGYVGIYEVSDLGNIKRLKGSERCNKDKIIKIKTKRNGYKFVALSKNNNIKYFHVHRLVAQAFLENKENKLYVNHKDMDKANNQLSNLEWVTAKENNNHARKNKKFNLNPRKGLSNKKSVSLFQIKDGLLVYTWINITEAAKHYNLSSSAIGNSIIRNTTCIGFNWEKITLEQYYIFSKKNPITPPIYNGNKHSRDLTKAKLSRINNLSKMDNNFLLLIGVECFKKYKRLIRKEYDIFSKEKKSLTYVPTSRRFGSWEQFKKEVIDYIINNL